MAIKDMKGTVTTTGIMNRRPEPLKVADMSKMKMPTNKNVNTPKEPPQEIVKTSFLGFCQKNYPIIG